MARRTLDERIFEARAKARTTVARKLRKWTLGAELIYPDDPAYDADVHPFAWAPLRLVHFDGQPNAPVSVAPYATVHATVTVFQGGIHHVDWVGAGHIRRTPEGHWYMPEGITYTNGPVVIGGDAWIAYEALIMSGVTIGPGAVVAARAVVTRSVEPYEIVGGNPIKHIRYRFDEDTRAALLRIAWWDWPAEKVERLRAEIDSPDVAGFVARHDPLNR